MLRYEGPWPGKPRWSVVGLTALVPVTIIVHAIATNAGRFDVSPGDLFATLATVFAGMLGLGGMALVYALKLATAVRRRWARRQRGR
jgi:hypothetical protein